MFFTNKLEFTAKVRSKGSQSVSLLDYSREKISHLSSGVECLLKSIEISTGSPGGADDLLPAIIFLLIYTNPPLFISNLNLIRRLAPPELLRRGEGAYHYCSICSGKFYIYNRLLFKGSSDPSHFIFEINVGKSRIRQTTTLK